MKGSGLHSRCCHRWHVSLRRLSSKEFPEGNKLVKHILSGDYYHCGRQHKTVAQCCIGTRGKLALVARQRQRVILSQEAMREDGDCAHLASESGTRYRGRLKEGGNRKEMQAKQLQARLNSPG